MARIGGVLAPGCAGRGQLHRNSLRDSVSLVPNQVHGAAADVDERVVGCVSRIDMRRAGWVITLVDRQAPLGNYDEAWARMRVPAGGAAWLPRVLLNIHVGIPVGPDDLVPGLRGLVVHKREEVAERRLRDRGSREPGSGRC